MDKAAKHPLQHSNCSAAAGKMHICLPNREGAAGVAATGTAAGVAVSTLTPLMGASLTGVCFSGSAVARTTKLRLDEGKAGRTEATALRDSRVAAIAMVVLESEKGQKEL